MLYLHRLGDANRQSVCICSRNDAIANIAVLPAALGVFGTGTGWPDIIVAAVMAGLSISGATQIIRQSLAELRSAQEPVEPAINSYDAMPASMAATNSHVAGLPKPSAASAGP